MNVVIGPPLAVPSSLQGAEDDAATGSGERAAGHRRARVGRAAITEQSLRATKAVQQAFDAAESSLRK